MNNVHDDAPVVFQTRWAMSYLCGPLTRGQIKTLMDPVRAKFAVGTPRDEANASGCSETAERIGAHSRCRCIRRPSRPVVPAGIREKFLAINDRVPDGYQLEYRPGLLGERQSAFRPQGGWHRRLARVLPACNRFTTTPPDDVWEGAIDDATSRRRRKMQPDERGQFADLPAELARDKSYSIFARQLKEHLYREGVAASCGNARRSKRSRNRTKRKPTSALGLRRCCKRNVLPQSAKLETVVRAKDWPTPNDQVAKAQAKVSTQRWQFFAELGSMLWVVVDTVMSAHGQGPARPATLARSGVSLRGHRTRPAVERANLSSKAPSRKAAASASSTTMSSSNLETSFSVAGVQHRHVRAQAAEGRHRSRRSFARVAAVSNQPGGAAEPVY